MKTYFKSLNLPTFLGALLTIGLTTVSCTSLNSSYYDTDGIYNKGKIKAPVTYNETAYYESYFDEKKNESFETFTDIDSYSSYENGNYPGWGDKNSTTNIFVNSGYNYPYWGGYNNWGFGGGYWGFGYNNYFGWGYPYYGGGFGWGFGWNSPYYGGWGNPYYGGGYGWGYPYYGNYNRRNVSYSSNTRTPSNGYRNISSNTRGSNNNLNRNNRAIIQDSRDRVNRLDARSSSRMDARSIRSTDIRNSNTRDNIRNSNTRDNNRNYNNSTPTRSSTISTPTRSSSPSPRMGGSGFGGGGRSSSGRR